MWTPRNAVTVRERPGGPTPASVPPSGSARISRALSGISAELAELPWDWPARMDNLTPTDAELDYFWDHIYPTYIESRSDARA